MDFLQFLEHSEVPKRPTNGFFLNTEIPQRSLNIIIYNFLEFPMHPINVNFLSIFLF